MGRMAAVFTRPSVPPGAVTHRGKVGSAPGNGGSMASELAGSKAVRAVRPRGGCCQSMGVSLKTGIWRSVFFWYSP